MREGGGTDYKGRKGKKTPTEGEIMARGTGAKLLKGRYYPIGLQTFFATCRLRTQDPSPGSQGYSQGSAFIERSVLSSGPTFTGALVTVWGISSICNLSSPTPCLQASGPAG